MPYLVKLGESQWLRRGRAVTRIRNATIYAHPSAAAQAMKKFPGATMVPLADVREDWLQDQRVAP